MRLILMNLANGLSSLISVAANQMENESNVFVMLSLACFNTSVSLSNTYVDTDIIHKVN